MPWHNKVFGYPTEIFDFVLGDSSYYSLFSCLDTNRKKIVISTTGRVDRAIIFINAFIVGSFLLIIFSKITYMR